MTALSVAKEALRRKEASQPTRLAQKAAKEGRTIFTVPEVGVTNNLATRALSSCSWSWQTA